MKRTFSQYFLVRETRTDGLQHCCVPSLRLFFSPFVIDSFFPYFSSFITKQITHFQTREGVVRLRGNWLARYAGENDELTTPVW
jgi:hypothetical protein